MRRDLNSTTLCWSAKRKREERWKRGEGRGKKEEEVEEQRRERSRGVKRDTQGGVPLTDNRPRGGVGGDGGEGEIARVTWTYSFVGPSLKAEQLQLHSGLDPILARYALKRNKAEFSQFLRQCEPESCMGLTVCLNIWFFSFSLGPVI